MGSGLVRRLDHKSIPDYVCSSAPAHGSDEIDETYSIPISAAWRMTAGSAPRQAAIPAAFYQNFHGEKRFGLTAIEHATPTSLFCISPASER